MNIDTSIRNSYNALISVIICSIYSSMSDATCSLPQDLTNAVWEYNYTKVSDNSEQSTTLIISTTTLQNSVINLNAFGTTIKDWTCTNSLDISDTEAVVVFKSDTSFTNGIFSGSRWLYLCMKLTKVTADLYYFYLLSDIFTAVNPDERVFASVEGNPPNDNDPVCSTFCQYTESPKIRTLRRQGTNDALPNDASLCEPCDISCDVELVQKIFIFYIPEATTESTQKTTLQSFSTEMDTTTDVISSETTQKTTVPSTSTEMDTTTEMTSIQKTERPFTSADIETSTEITSTQKTTLPPTSTEIKTTTEMVSTTTTHETILPSTSTEIDTTIEITSKGTTQTTAVLSTATDLETTLQTTIPSTSKDTETTTELTVTTTDVKDETTLEIHSTDTENIKQYSGPIILAVSACFGCLIVIIAFVYLKGRSMVNTEQRTNNKGQESYDFTPETCYIYKGKQFGFQKIAIQHWDNH
ncbi:unnamed protein product [Mytilus coruscus]|uniref:Uncharacterized protein n=1 Tax=Mytilus coruscus TaxID=42192 RepID=A0A6J8B6P5_MYTCO|nr:unnamed protein product [Mytilus coruscus]